MNRYERARHRLSARMCDDIARQFHGALNREPQDATREDMAAVHVVFPAPDGGGSIYCVCSVEDDPRDDLGPEEHVSVSRGRGAPLPTWDDLVLVRALAWPDDAEVVQVLPALAGPSATSWVTIPGVEVLHLRRYRARRR